MLLLGPQYCQCGWKVYMFSVFYIAVTIDVAPHTNRTIRIINSIDKD